MEQSSGAEVPFKQIHVREKPVANPGPLPETFGHAERGNPQRRRRSPKQHRRIRYRPVAKDHPRYDAERENELPGQGIEKPGVGLGPTREREAESFRGGVDRERTAQREPRAYARHRQDRRRPQHQHDIERQNIEIIELLGKQQNSRRCLQRLVKDGASPLRLDQVRRAAEPISDGGDRDRRAGQTDMHAVDTKRPAEAALDKSAPIRLLRSPEIGERDRDPRQENKRFRAVGEREIARRRFLDPIARDVIAEDQNQHDSPPKVDGINSTLFGGLR